MATLLIEQALVSRLKSDATLATLLGATAADPHIHPSVMVQQEALPVIVYQKISDVPDYVMGGQSGLSVTRFQITVWTGMDPATSGGYLQACAITDRVRMILSGWHGTVTIGADSIDVNYVTLDNQIDNYDPEAGRGLAMQARISDYLITYKQTIPTFS